MPHTSHEGALADLLTGLYDAPGLRRFLRRGPYGEEISNELPAELAQPAELAHQAVLALLRRGLVNQELFDRLRADRSERVEEIDGVNQQWSRHLQPSPPALGFRSASATLGAAAALLLLIAGWALFLRDSAPDSPATTVSSPSGTAIVPTESAPTTTEGAMPTPAPALTDPPSSALPASSSSADSVSPTSTVTIKTDGQGSTAVGGNLKASADQVTIDANNGATGVKEDATITSPDARVTATGGATGIEGDAFFEAK